MAYTEQREYRRYSLEGSIELEFLKNFQKGKLINTSLGGVFVEMDGNCSQIEIGKKSKIYVFDIFSDKKCEFDCETVRISGSRIAFKFLNPLNDYQKLFLEQWFYMFDNPSPEPTLL